MMKIPDTLSNLKVEKIKGCGKMNENKANINCEEQANAKPHSNH